MKKILVVCVMILAMVSCGKEYPVVKDESGKEMQSGVMIVNMIHEAEPTKAATTYVSVLEEEKAEHKVEVMVFDKGTDVLSASKKLKSVADGCTFTMPVGSKTIYVIVNGPELSAVRNLSQLKQILDDLSKTTIKGNGLMMVGSADCNVTANAVARPLIVVKRLVARVVLQKITCSIPAQFGKMKVDCVYLGNAYSRQTVSGTVSEMCNMNGYAGQKTDPIGKNGVTGSCSDYFFRSVNAEISVGATSLSKYHMYCQPNGTDTHTCLYLLATIGGSQYYYRVPLHNKLKPNTTCSVEVDIINLGAQLPPDNDVQKGEIVAEIKIDGWAAGDNYSVQF